MNISSLYESWKQNTALINENCLSDSENLPLHKELLSIDGNTEEINDRFYTELDFGTAGLRGVIGVSYTHLTLPTTEVV